MATSEDQTQSFIGILFRIPIGIIPMVFHVSLQLRKLLNFWLQTFCFVFEFGLLFGPGPFTTHRIEKLPMCNGGQPRAWVTRNAVACPRSEGCGESFLQRLFSQIKRTGQADQRGDNASVFLAKDALEYFACGRHAAKRTRERKKGERGT